MTKRQLKVSFTDFAVAALIFEPAFVESLHRKVSAQEETRRIVERLAKQRSNGVSAKDVARELGISTYLAYRRLRTAEAAGLVQRANKPEKRNRKRFIATARPKFLPDPEKLYRRLNLDERVKFVHPISGEWVLYHRRHG